jgi:hypothetical protein
VPVNVRIPAVNSADLAAANRVPVLVRMKRAGSVRLAASLTHSSGVRVNLGATRLVPLAANRWKAAAVPISPAGRSLLQSCPGGKIAVTVTGTSVGRGRTVTRSFKVPPPSCGRFFGPAAIWNTPLTADARLDPDSAAVTQDLQQKVDAGNRGGLPPTIATRAYAPPVYTVPTRQARVRVTLPPGKDRSLVAAFDSVPLPAGVRPAPGSDGELVLWQPGSDTIWEFWRLHRAHGAWHATWGGQLDHVSTGPGHFTAPHESWGTTASSLALTGGMMTPRELATGRIEHALSMAVPQPRASAFSRPAQRTDGPSPCVHAVPEGARFRLDPSLDVASLGLAPPVAAMARAAQKYGIYVRDKSDAVTFYAQSSVSLPADPYPAIFGGRPPYELLRSFPWSHLQLMKMDLVPTGRGNPLQAVLQGCG